MSVECISPHTPLLYSKKGVNSDIPIFLIFDPEHKLWVLTEAVLKHVPTFNVLNVNIKTIKIFPMKFSIFTAEKSLCILHGQVFVLQLTLHKQWLQRVGGFIHVTKKKNLYKRQIWVWISNYLMPKYLFKFLFPFYHIKEV